MSRILTCVGCALVALGASSPAAWGFTASAQVSPPAIAYYGPTDPRTTRIVEHRLHITAGPRPEHVQIDGIDPGDPGPVVRGPAKLRQLSSTTMVGDDFGSPGRDGCRPQASGGPVARYELALPARSSSTIVFTRRLDRSSAPRTASEFVASFSIERMPATTSGVVTITSRVPRLTGLTAAKLVLRAGLTKSATRIGDRELLPVKPHSAMTISGSLDPARHADRVTIWVYRPLARRPARLAVVRVGHHGLFAYRRWRPASQGIWELYATWPGRRDRIEHARSACGGPQINVTDHVGTGRPQTPGPAARAAASRSPHAEPPVVVTSMRAPCTDCSIPERMRPSDLLLITPRPRESTITYTATALTWTRWTTASAEAHGRLRITDHRTVSGNARVVLDQPRRHLSDGCGNRGTGTIFTRARLWISDTNDRRLDGGPYTFRLPRTGCETY